MLRIAYVEDELPAATGLQNCLERYGREHGLELQIHAYQTADALLQQYNPATDILFLDVELPGTSGMEAARQLRNRGYEGALVFVTNMAQYAVQGYEVDALDFLVKPVNPFAFTVKMNRILRRVRNRAGHTICLNLADGIRKLDVRQIYYLETFDHTLHYHTEQGTFSLRGSLSAAEKTLGPWHFARCNQCYLVNLRHVNGVTGNQVLVGEHALEISRRCRAAFLAAVTAYMGGET